MDNVNSVQVTTNFDDVNALGQKLGRAALAQVKGMTAKGPLAKPDIRVVSERVELEPRAGPPPVLVILELSRKHAVERGLQAAEAFLMQGRPGTCQAQPQSPFGELQVRVGFPVNPSNFNGAAA